MPILKALSRPYGTMLRQPSGTFNPFQRIYLLLRLRNIAIEISKSAEGVTNVQGLVKTHCFSLA
jgi:hypothetical protein